MCSYPNEKWSLSKPTCRVKSLNLWLNNVSKFLKWGVSASCTFVLRDGLPAVRKNQTREEELPIRCLGLTPGQRLVKNEITRCAALSGKRYHSFFWLPPGQQRRRWWSDMKKIPQGTENSVPCMPASSLLPKSIKKEEETGLLSLLIITTSPSQLSAVRCVFFNLDIFVENKNKIGPFPLERTQPLAQLD